MALRIVSLLLVASVPAVLASPYGTRSASVAPLHVPDTTPGQLIGDSYIIKLRDDVSLDVFNAHLSFLELAVRSSSLWVEEEPVSRVWNSRIIKGYAGRFPQDVIDIIRRKSEVEFVEQEQIVRTADTQEPAPWGLARISHRTKLVSSPNSTYRYEFATNGGEGVTVYVVDSGVNVNHVEFEGRARWGTNVIKGNNKDVDETGHGTHVAGTIASRAYGVAKRANITAVKVFNATGSGPIQDIVTGLEWADADAVRLAEETAAERSSFKSSIINLSLSTAKSLALASAVKKAIAHGHHVVVAAGNFRSNACRFSPADVEEAISVGAVTIDDRRWVSSNFGQCVDIFAPGHNVRSTWNKGLNSSYVLSGTSMAAPHVSGVLAYLISIYPHATFFPTSTPSRAAPPQSRLWTAYAAAYHALPEMLSIVLPSPLLLTSNEEPEIPPAPVPDVLTPAKLKKTLLKLATKGVIGDTMSPTNLLLFNNATAPDGSSWVDQIWSES